MGLSTDLVDLSPFLSRFLCESFVNHWHDLVKQLTTYKVSQQDAFILFHALAVSAIGDLLHQTRRGAPGFIIRGFSDLSS